MKYKTVYYLLTLFVLLATSCTKDGKLDPLPNNLITEFKVAVSDGEIYAAVDNEENTIVLTVPFYYDLDYVEPIITVSDGATLTEQSEDDNLVSVLDTTKTYTVKDGSGAERTYKLRIDIQQLAPLQVREISSETTTRQFGINKSLGGIYGNFNTLDANKIEVSLVNAKGESFDLVPDAAGYKIRMIEEFYVLESPFIPETLDTGTYKVRVKLLALSTELQYPIKLTYAQSAPVYGQGATSVMTRGGTYTLKALLGVYHAPERIEITLDGVVYNLPVKSFDRTSVVVSVPENLPTGVYSNIQTTLIQKNDEGNSTFKQAITIN